MGCVFTGLWMKPAEAYYMVTETARLEVEGATRFSSTQEGSRYIKQDFRLTNTGEKPLKEVGVVWQFLYAGPGAFLYDNLEHRWERSITLNGVEQTLWLEGLTYDPLKNPDGESTYFSMGRDQSDAALEYELSAREVCRLAETDEVPVFWLGDIEAGGSAFFSLYAGQGLYQEGVYQEGWSFSPVFQYVAQAAPVPAPAAVWLLGSGIVSFHVLRTRGKKKEKRNR